MSASNYTIIRRFRSVAKGVVMDVKGVGVCETPLAFMRFLRASKNVVKSVMNIFALTRPTRHNRLSR